MSMFPHAITAYTDIVTTDPETFRSATARYIAVLRGVLVIASKAVNASENGANEADSVEVHIPLDVTATDGVTGVEARYASPKAFQLAESKTGLWTLIPGTTFFVKGEAIEPDKTRAEIEEKYDGVYSVTGVDENDFGSPDMQHWRVRGS